MQFEEYALRLNARLCKPIKGQSKTTRTQFCQLIHKNSTYWGKNLDRCCTRRIFNLRFYEVSKKLIHLLRHGRLRRENDGAIEFWRITDNLQELFFIVIIGLTTSGRKPWQEEEETRKYTSIVLIRQEQSCTSELFKASQDAVSLIQLYRTMSLFRATSSSTFIMSDVQSICTPSSIRD